jgi:hypothetical protein
MYVPSKPTRQQIATAAAKDAPPIRPAWTVEQCCPDHEVWFVISTKPTRDLDRTPMAANSVDSVHATPDKARWVAERLNEAHKAYVEKQKQR